MAAVERRTGHRPLAHTISRDGRLARDWVPQYTDIIARQYLPKRWPRLVRSTAKACDLTGGSREIHLAPAVSQPRFSHTSSVADARFIV